MGKSAAVLALIGALCRRIENPSRIRIRRNGGVFRAAKLLYLMRRYAPDIHAAVMEVTGCRDDGCAARAVKMVLQRNLLSFGTVSTLGELCNEVGSLPRLRARD